MQWWWRETGAQDAIRPHMRTTASVKMLQPTGSGTGWQNGRDVEESCGGREGRESLGFVAGSDGGVDSVGGVAVDVEAAVFEVDDPVFGDGGAGVEADLGAEVEGEGGVGNLDQEADV